MQKIVFELLKANKGIINTIKHRGDKKTRHILGHKTHIKDVFKRMVELKIIMVRNLECR